MPRPRTPVALLFAGLIAVPGLVGCGKKPKPDSEPEPAVPAVTPTPQPPVPAKNETPPEPKKDESARPGNTAFSKFGPVKLPTADPLPGPLASAPMPKESPVKDPAPVVPQPTNPLPPPPSGDMAPKPKDPEKQEWPTSILGRPMSEYIKDINDPDPAVREMALRTIPNFGPPARAAAVKDVLNRMDASREHDPGVRAAAFNAASTLALMGEKEPGFDDHNDTQRALDLLKTAILNGVPGGGTRLHAVQCLAAFGAKAEGVIQYITGLNMTTPEREPAYETRRAVATTLGQIAFDEKNGPSTRALACLTNVLIKDPSAAVRLAAYQSVVILGPPILPAAPPLGPKNPPKPNQKELDLYLKAIKARLGPNAKTPTGLVEPNAQVEIFARLSLIRLDPVNETNANLPAIARYVAGPGPDSGPKRMALNAIALMGTGAGKALDDVVKGLLDEDPVVATDALAALVSMGYAAQPAIPNIEKFRDAQIAKLKGIKLSDRDKEAQKKYWTDLTDKVIKTIKESKPPAGAQ